jgi:starvation-inducible DNA-binding protein
VNERGFQWNIQGARFFELHLKFEELYNSLVIKVDEIAERILTLGERPLHSFSAYLKISEIEEKVNFTAEGESLNHILNSLQLMLIKQREILVMASEIDDEGTSALMSDYIREQEKMVWMYSAFLKRA